jgi:hypothetical protein
VNFFARVLSLINESCEILCESLFPEEFEVIILENEVTSGILNFSQIVGYDLESTEKLELVLDLNKVITVAGIETWHLDSQRYEVIGYLQNDVSNTIAS